MTAPTTTLADRLLAHLDEEERVARDAHRYDPAPWSADAMTDSIFSEVREWVAETRPTAAAHIARQDPAATLRRVGGLREVVRLHVPRARHFLDVGTVDMCAACEDEDYPCPTLVALAGALGVEG